MKAIDTNVIVRFLVKDDIRQAEAVYELFKQAEDNQDELYIPILVIFETLWVLESVYEITREEILNAIGALVLMPIFKFEVQPVIQRFLVSAHESKTDLSDLLIACSAKFAGCDTVLTFDKKASRSELFELIHP